MDARLRPHLCQTRKARREVAIARFRFNAWARYPDWKKDDAIPAQAVRRLKMKIFRAHIGQGDVVLEGGSIDVNGSGTLLTPKSAFSIKNARSEIRGSIVRRPKRRCEDTSA